MLRLFEDHNNQQFEISSGECVLIELSENATTGYVWHAVFEGKYISSYTQNSEDAIGSGSNRQFTITTSTPGTYLFKADLYREWMGVNTSIKQFRVVLIVK